MSSVTNPQGAKPASPVKKLEFPMGSGKALRNYMKQLTDFE